MPELYDLVERRIGDYTPSPDLRERVNERAQRRRRTRRAGSALVAVVALAVVFGGLSRVLAPSRVVVFDQPDGEALTEPVVAPSSLSELREYAFHIADVPGFAQALRWEVTPDGQTTFVRWLEHNYEIRVGVHYQGMYQDEWPLSPQSVSVHDVTGYYVEGESFFDQPRTNARVVWEYARDSWAEVRVTGLPADLEGFNEGSFQELPPEAETRAALLEIAEAVRSGGSPVRFPFRLTAAPAPLPSGDTAWRMSVSHEGGAHWSATLGLGDPNASPSLWVTSGHKPHDCKDDMSEDSAPVETFTYRGHTGCLIRDTSGGQVHIVVLQVGAQQRSILMNLDGDAPPTPLTQYPLEDLKRLLAELTASSDDPNGWFDLPTALGAR